MQRFILYSWTGNVQNGGSKILDGFFYLWTHSFQHWKQITKSLSSSIIQNTEGTIGVASVDFNYNYFQLDSFQTRKLCIIYILDYNKWKFIWLAEDGGWSIDGHLFYDIIQSRIMKINCFTECRMLILQLCCSGVKK